MQEVELAPAVASTPPLGAPRSQRGLFALLLCAAVTATGTIASIRLGPVAGTAAAKAMPGHWPLFVLAANVAIVITLITVVRLPAFIALVLAAISAGLMARVGSLPLVTGAEAQPAHWTRAVELTAMGLGDMVTKVGLVIALAAAIGTCMLESGAADKVVRRCLAVFGEKRAGLALLVGTYVVSIPIFFDTIFMLLIPLAKALRLRTGKDYVLYMMAICCAALITHSMVIPHPGPSAMVDTLHLDAGITILIGWLTGIIPLAIGWVVINLINRKVEVPLVETPGATLADLRAVMERTERELPSLSASLAPVLLPVLLISLASFLGAYRKHHPDLHVGMAGIDGWIGGHGGAVSAIAATIEFLGNRHVALLISLALASAVLMRQRGLGMRQVGALMAPSIELAAIMILITAAGGAFGIMLQNAHVADAIKVAADGRNINLILLAWTVALVIRIAQGSATVAMIVTAGMVYPLTQSGLPYSPMYLFLAIGYGAMGCSWMNDGGFWVVGKLGGMTERETLKTWTVLTSSIAVAGLLTTLLMSTLLPDLGASLFANIHR